MLEVDVLCIGHACYDLVFSVPHHPASDEKIFADSLLACGGGPAANAAIAVSRLGYRAAFAGYLGQDLYGKQHYQEFIESKVNTSLVVRGDFPTPLSTVLVKNDGQRALINYKGLTRPLDADEIDFLKIKPKVILLDGHEPYVSLSIVKFAKMEGIPVVLDAGSLHKGTELLMSQVDYLVASEKFACQYAGDVNVALDRLANITPVVVITLGEKGLIWKEGQQTGSLPALSVDVVDTTGAGDAFHGAFAAALAAGKDWQDILKYASAAGSFCCTQLGARTGLPLHDEHDLLYQQMMNLP